MGYDNAGRLTSANLAAAGSRPAVSYGYGFAASGGCGADSAAGLDSARSSQTVTIGTGTPATTVSCTDYASRLTSVTGVGAIAASQITYDSHGNITKLGGQAFGYDASDRVTQMAVTNTDGSTQTTKYALDSVGRVVTRTATGTGANAENDATTYAYAGGSDSPTAQLTSAKALGEVYLSLPGGVLLTKRYANTGGDDWAYPNLHGDITATANSTGMLTASGFVYDPFGQPLNPATGTTNLTSTPKTRTNGPTDAWEGQHQRGYENQNGDNAVLMGARIYLPALGQFAATDPVLDGNANTYAYPGDPINHADLSGRSSAATEAVAAPSAATVVQRILVSDMTGVGDPSAMADFLPRDPLVSRTGPTAAGESNAQSMAEAAAARAEAANDGPPVPSPTPSASTPRPGSRSSRPRPSASPGPASDPHGTGMTALGNEAIAFGACTGGAIATNSIVDTLSGPFDLTGVPPLVATAFGCAGGLVLDQLGLGDLLNSLLDSL